MQESTTEQSKIIQRINDIWKHIRLDYYINGNAQITIKEYKDKKGKLHKQHHVHIANGKIWCDCEAFIRGRKDHRECKHQNGAVLLVLEHVSNNGINTYISKEWAAEYFERKDI